MSVSRKKTVFWTQLGSRTQEFTAIEMQAEDLRRLQADQTPALRGKEGRKSHP